MTPAQIDAAVQSAFLAVMHRTEWNARIDVTLTEGDDLFHFKVTDDRPWLTYALIDGTIRSRVMMCITGDAEWVHRLESLAQVEWDNRSD